VTLKILIRQAREDDLPAMEWDGEYSHFRNVYRYALEEARVGRRILLLAETAGRLIGQIFIQIEGLKPGISNGKSTAYLYSFRVREGYRNLGIGSKLLQKAETLLQSKGVERCVISVAKDNPSAQELYERRGYVVFGEDPGRWSYVDQHEQVKNVHEPSYLLAKDFPSPLETPTKK
jgi:ribosomal protein S18 acetylase RimI-like enzyme